MPTHAYIHTCMLHTYIHTHIHTYMYVAVTVLLVNIILYQMFSDTIHKVNSVGTVYHEITPQIDYKSIDIINLCNIAVLSEKIQFSG